MKRVYGLFVLHVCLVLMMIWSRLGRLCFNLIDMMSTEVAMYGMLGGKLLEQWKYVENILGIMLCVEKPQPYKFC